MRQRLAACFTAKDVRSTATFTLENVRLILGDELSLEIEKIGENTRSVLCRLLSASNSIYV